MKRALVEFIERLTRVRLSQAGEVRTLTEDQRSLLVALYRLVTGERKVSRNTILQFVESRIAGDAGYVVVYEQAEKLLNSAARLTKPEARPFVDLRTPEREAVLRKLLKDYPHPENEASWRHWLRLKRHAIEQVIALPSRKRLRNFVVREFLNHHFGGTKSWELVGYESFPGNPAEELSEVDLISVEARRSLVSLQLSDGTFENLTRGEFEELSRSGVPSIIPVKSGRQQARLAGDVREQWMRAESLDARGAARREPHGTSCGTHRTAYDCVIVGSGPVGAAAADVLVRAGLQVAMLESGASPERNRFGVMRKFLDNQIPWEFDPWAYEMRGDDLQLNNFAVRKVGGSSLAWDAVTPRFLENDFRLESLYGVGWDWPIAYRDLGGDYLAAERFMGVSGHDDNPFLPKREAPFPMRGFEMSDTDLLVREGCAKLGIALHSIPAARNTQSYQGRSKCLNYAVCHACPVGAVYSSDQTIDRLREAGNFRLITRAHARKVVTGPGNRIDAVRYHDRDGREHTLRAESVVLAAQGIENVRILLNSMSNANPAGVANASGLLGKHLTDHMKFHMIGRVSARLSPHLRGYETVTSQQFQDHPERGEFAGGRIVVRENAGPAPMDLVLRSGRWSEALRREIRETFGHFVTLGAYMEQLPYEDNRIELSATRKNAFGDPAPLIHFKLMRGYERRGYRRMKSILNSIFRELDARNVRVITPPSVAGHFMCCHRMGSTAADSVVDSFCEAHDVAGLYLAGSGSFTTGGVSNPTLTGVALAIRMANRIVNGRPDAGVPAEYARSSKAMALQT